MSKGTLTNSKPASDVPQLRRYQHWASVECPNQTQSLQGWAMQACSKARRTENLALPPMRLQLSFFLNLSLVAKSWNGVRNAVLVEALQLK